MSQQFCVYILTRPFKAFSDSPKRAYKVYQSWSAWKFINHDCGLYRNTAAKRDEMRTALLFVARIHELLPYNENSTCPPLGYLFVVSEVSLLKRLRCAITRCSIIMHNYRQYGVNLPENGFEYVSPM